MGKSKKRNYCQYSTGNAAIMLYGSLLRDFRTIEGDSFMQGADHDLLSDITKFRARESKDLGIVSVGRFKRYKQMESFIKKFRFDEDAYTDAELSEKTLNSFLDEQVRLHKPMPLRSSGRAVLQRARIIARRILGEYPGDEVIENCQFGRKSSIGCPLSLAYVDIKLSLKRAFTGTKETVKHFFDQVLPGDHVLRRILRNHDFDSMKEQLDTPYLNLVEVPKTWDKYRLITPLTLIGLFFSYGIGRVITSRLKDAGLNIGKLQDIHRSLVKGYSASRSHATADLSSASDSITSELLNYILPRPWYCALKKTFVRQLRVDDKGFSTVSVLPMGNGATFPTETLVFYCLIKAIGELTGVEGTYSVYGDDLIYPSRLHPYVTALFPQFHLKLNLDKTFVSYPFRESCGADFYRGSDVRPYFLKGDAEYLTRVRYEAFLYKVYNGLTARWDPQEIKGTLTWLLSELAIVSHGILRVPPHFPDFSGIRVSHWREVPLDYNLLPFTPVLLPFKHGSRWFQFDFLEETAKKRVVKMTQPYYWLSLQGITDEVVDDYVKKAKERSELETAWFEWSKRQTPADAKRSSLEWKKCGIKKTTYYSKGRKFVKKRTLYNAVVDSRKGSTVSTATTKTGTISDWT